MNADIFFELDRFGSSSTSSCRLSGFSNAKTQRRKDAKTTHPPDFQRREAFAGFLCVARSRPSNGRKPLGRATVTKTSSRPGVPAQRLALPERKPRHLSSPFNSWEGHAPSPKYGREERQNRRAPGTSVGEKTGCDERSGSEQAGFSPATGDLLVVCRSAGKKRKRLSNSVTAPLRLCVFAPLRSFSGGWVALRLCGSAPLRFFLCVPLCASVSLWFFVPRSVGIVE